MHYEEKFINGILHFRTTPDGEWQIARAKYAQVANALLGLSSEDRHLALSALRKVICFECFENQPERGICQCWNDD